MNSASRLPGTAGFNPWPYGLTAFLVLFVASALLFVRFALGHPVDLVRTDYYDQEIRHQEQIDRVNRTAQLGAAAAIVRDQASGDLTVRIPLPQVRTGAEGTIQFYRPSDSRLDRSLALAPDAEGLQSIDLGDLAPGRWRVRVAWKSEGREYFLESRVDVSAPGA